MAAVAHLAAHPELPAPDPARLLHARRGDRRGRDAVRHRALRRALRLHAGRLGPSASSRTRRSPPRRSIVTIAGVDVHPGLATGKLVNADAAGRRGSSPRCRRTLTPETHAGPRGLHPRLRARRRRRAARRSARSCATSTTSCSSATSRCCAGPPRRSWPREPRARLEVEVRRSTRTCADTSSRTPRSSQPAERAIRAEGIEPRRTPIRGGTDGSRLSAMGLPTPNIFTGGHEYHSRARVGLGAGDGRPPRRRSSGSPRSGPTASANRSGRGSHDRVTA